MTKYLPRRLRRQRPRGGASVQCPLCAADSSVVYTRRTGAAVYRLRECTAGHKFPTNELPRAEAAAAEEA